MMTKTKQETLQQIEKQKAVCVLRIPDDTLFEPVAEALYRGGIRLLEITMTVPNATKLIKKAKRTLPGDMVIGVGSVLTRRSTQEAIEAGAEFIVSPILKQEIIEAAKAENKVVMCGAFTPTEIQTSWELGCDIVKVFPANILGMDFFKAVKAPMPHLKLMPTGGVSLTNGKEWLKAGACAVGVGSALVSSEDLKNRDFESITEKAQLLISNING
jgi:2-dehydro-3-deoxyphosphogluconate aldolase/(4S)-4-hydroxy-2-oxoglutarate aldolase